MSDTLGGLAINEASVNDSGLASATVSVLDGMAMPLDTNLAQSGVGETYYVAAVPDVFYVPAAVGGRP